jgi:hypothetical protein
MIRSSQDRLLPVPVASPQDKGSRDKDGAGLRSGRASRLSNSYAAQLLGQDGQRRGLRGGAPVLDAARSAYLGAEYSGENDRRPLSGLIAKKAI